mgnify:CR=1 FL=1
MLGLYIVGMFALGIGFIVGTIRCITAFVKKKPNRIQELFSVLLIFVVLIADFNELKKVYSAGTTDGNKMQETVTVDTETGYRKIYEAFCENEIVAKELCKGNRYRISDEIDSIDSIGDEGYLTIAVDVGEDYPVWVYAYFDKEETEGLKALKSGQQVSVDGECAGKITFDHCTLVGGV